MEDNFYKDMLHNAPFGYAYHKIILDEHNQPFDYVFLEINPAFTQLTGLKAENVVGKTVREVLPNIIDGEFDWIGFYGEIALSGNKKEFEQYSLPQDRWYKVQAYSDKKYFFSAIFTDITSRKKTEIELKESEQRFRLLYENAPIAYQSLDEHGCFVDVNQRWLSTLGYRKDEVLGHSFAEFLHPDWRQHFSINFPKFKELGEVSGVEFWMMKKDGEQILVSFDGKIGYDEKGRFKQTHCVFIDITQQRKLQTEKEQMQAQLFHSSKLATLGTLAAGVAHEINNPLAIIVGSCDMLEGKVNREIKDVLKTIEVIKGASERIAAIVKGLKVYARKDADAREEVNTHEVIAETLIFIQGIFKKENIEIETRLNANHFIICLHKGKFQQVLVNLINNAKDALEDKENGKIIISTKNQDYRQLVVEVEDNGAGIPTEMLGKLFDPFFTTKGPGKGTGLGLPICQSIVEAYNGKIKVESVPGKGTIFKLIFGY